MPPIIQVKVAFKNRGNIDLKQKLRVALESANGSYVSVGINEGSKRYDDGVTVAQVALWMEFGTEVGGEVRCPQRSFLRSTFREQQATINAFRLEGLRNLMLKGWSVEKALTMIGFRTVVLIQNKIKSNVPPPLSPAYAALKKQRGQPNETLIATGALLDAIDFRVHLKSAAPTPGGT